MLLVCLYLGLSTFCQNGSSSEAASSTKQENKFGAVTGQSTKPAGSKSWAWMVSASSVQASESTRSAISQSLDVYARARLRQWLTWPVMSVA